jgi:GNAT superfamily N-acetyltransferase
LEIEEINTDDYRCFYIIINNMYRAVAEFSKIKNQTYYFNRLFVPPNIRNMGIATKLMKQAIKWADDEHIEILLEINSYGDLTYDRLLKFYQKFGFKFNKNKILIRNVM